MDMMTREISDVSLIWLVIVMSDDEGGLRGLIKMADAEGSRDLLIEIVQETELKPKYRRIISSGGLLSDDKASYWSFISDVYIGYVNAKAELKRCLDELY